jgi:crossover junction endodeoxyribonuclease RusA
MTFDLPYPPAKLSPNARVHWADHARAKAKYRTQCYYKAKYRTQCYYTGLAPRYERWSLSLPIQITFHPPDRRRRDRDNMIAAFKAGADGIADAIGVDDAEWSPTYLVGDPVKGGKVTVTIG